MKRKLTPALQYFGVSLLVSLPVGVLHADSIDATTHNVQGNPTFVSPGGTTTKIAPGVSVPAGSTVSTGANGLAGLELVPGATTVPTANTDVKVKSLDYSKSPNGAVTRHVVLDLRRGSIFNSLAKHDGNSTFEVITPKGVAAARGTDWALIVAPDSGITIVEVLDGTITFRLPNGTIIQVPTGGEYNSDTGEITNLSDKDKQAIIDAIQAGGFDLAGGPTGDDSLLFTPGQTINPSNVSSQPENSANQ